MFQNPRSGPTSKVSPQSRGYTEYVEFDDEARIFHGEVIDLKDVVACQGTSVEKLEEAFRESIDDYLEFCEKRGEEPGRKAAT